jgi:molybdopterin-binding protein
MNDFGTKRTSSATTEHAPLFAIRYNPGPLAKAHMAQLQITVTHDRRPSHVSIDIGQGSILMASVTTEAVADLDLKVGDDAWAIEASDVPVAK